MAQLTLDQNQIDRARSSARRIAEAVHKEMTQYTTSTVERATLRLLGLDGVDSEFIPLPNRVVEHLKVNELLGYGAVLPVFSAMVETGMSLQEVGDAVAEGKLTLKKPENLEKIRPLVDAAAKASCARIKSNREDRSDKIKKWGEGPQPWLYLIVATGNIYEDIKQAQAAAEQGADVIAVIRSTGQSLLDYVPYGPTTEGFGGTFATQENFRLMRAALDETGEKVGRYIRLTNYCSGLCMP